MVVYTTRLLFFSNVSLGIAERAVLVAPVLWEARLIILIPRREVEIRTDPLINVMEDSGARS